MSLRRLNALVWFGVLGGALAWAAQLALGYELGLARCSSPSARFPISFHTWGIALASTAAVVALLAEAAAIVVFRATREAQQVRLTRIHFLATAAMTVNPLVLAISAMTGVGTALLTLCHQS